MSVYLHHCLKRMNSSSVFTHIMCALISQTNSSKIKYHLVPLKPGFNTQFKNGRTNIYVNIRKKFKYFVP